MRLAQRTDITLLMKFGPSLACRARCIPACSSAENSSWPNLENCGWPGVPCSVILCNTNHSVHYTATCGSACAGCCKCIARIRRDTTLIWIGRLGIKGYTGNCRFIRFNFINYTLFSHYNKDNLEDIRTPFSYAARSVNLQAGRTPGPRPRAWCPRTRRPLTEAAWTAGWPGSRCLPAARPY